MAPPFSDLEVAPKFSDLEVVSKFSDLEVARRSLYPNYYHEGLEHDTTKLNPTQRHLDSHKQACNSISSQRRICGLVPRAFWIIMAVGILVVIGAAVAGGVGGILASKNNRSSESASQTSGNSMGPTRTFQSSSGRATESTTSASSARSTSSTALSSSARSTASTTPSRTSTVALTTTQVIGPSYTLQRDCPSSNNTIYDITVGSADMSFRKICENSYLNTLQALGENRGATVNSVASSLDECIGFCAEYNVRNASGIASAQNFVCNAVCWRNGLDDDDFPGQCFGFTTQNSSNSFVLRDEVKCDSAAWINQRIL